jgi:hypothetical protein
VFNSTNDRDLAYRIAQIIEPRKVGEARPALLAAIEAARQVLDDDRRRLPFVPRDSHFEALLVKSVRAAISRDFDWKVSPSANAARSAYLTFNH